MSDKLIMLIVVLIVVLVIVSSLLSATVLNKSYRAQIRKAWKNKWFAVPGMDIPQIDVSAPWKTIPRKERVRK